MRAAACALLLFACARRRETPPTPAPRVVAEVIVAPASVVDAGRPRACVASPTLGHVLAQRSDELDVVALGREALVVNDYSEHIDPSFCERHEEQCLGDWAGSRFNPLSEAYVVGEEIPAAVRRFEPAHHAHSDSSAAGPSSFGDFAAGLTLDGRFATMVFGTEYMGPSCDATLGDAAGRRLARAGIFRDDFESPQLAVGTHAAAGFGATALGVLALPARYAYTDEESEPPPSSVLGFAWREGHLRRQVLYEPGAGAHAEVPAVALREGGGAVAMRVGSRLLMLNLNAQGQRAGAPVVLSATRPGAPTMAWDGANLMVIWASRARASLPFRLQLLRWDPSTPPPAPTALATGEASAFAPSLSVREGRVALAWMEGNDRQGRIRAGLSSVSVDDAVAHAITVSAADGNARDPEIALGERGAWVVWQEVVPTAPPSRAAPTARARIVSLRCE